MADETFASIQNLVRDQKGPLVEALQWSTVMLSEIEREGGEEFFDGEKVKIPIILAPLQGGSIGTTESGILPDPRRISHNKVRVDTGIASMTVSFTTKADLAAARRGDNSWIALIPDKMEMAEEGLRRNINEALCGNGDALIAAITANTGPSTSVTVGTSANFYQLYGERVLDILTRATGAPVQLGVKVVDYNESAGTVTLDTSVTVTTAEGLYIPNSYGNAIAGIMQAVATTGTFQELDKATTWAWRGVDASPSAASDPSLAIMDRAERLSAQRAGKTPQFYIADPAVIDRFTQGLTLQARWAGDDGMLESGWEGVRYRNKVIVREYDLPPGTAIGVTPDDIKIYSREEGPDWDDLDTLFKRFARALPFEAWLVWHLQLGFRRCITQTKVGSLNRAA